jgi:hypothetical protein
VAAFGFLITLTGLLMLVLPGPALVVIPLGLAVLALEFAWAERALHRTVEHAEAARRRAAGASLAQRLVSVAAVGLAAAAAVAAAVVWDVPYLPV